MYSEFCRLSCIVLSFAQLTTLFFSCVEASANARYAAFIMDANTGSVLHAENPDSLRYPASLTKMMTLYLTFEALEKKRIKKSTAVFFSRLASSQPPTKLGVPSGKSITVEQAIHALVTRSANDASVALAELLSRSPSRFAQKMTKKAKALGMKKTVFRNPNGLPNVHQVTTARDMAILGLSLLRHFPQYYRYFSVRSFTFGRTKIANHNKLLGHVEGVDGIKTGYTKASGFNLVSSACDGKRRIIAVVMGMKSSHARNHLMKEMIQTWMPRAASRKMQKNSPIAPQILDPEGFVDLPLHVFLPSPGQKKPAPESFEPEDTISEIILANKTPFESESLPVHGYVQAPSTLPSALPLSSASLLSRKKWMIQLASWTSRKQAKAALAKNRAKMLALSDLPSHIVPVRRKGVTLYQVRFKGFASSQLASRACKLLKRKGLSSCLVLPGGDRKKAIKATGKE